MSEVEHIDVKGMFSAIADATKVFGQYQLAVKEEFRELAYAAPAFKSEKDERREMAKALAQSVKDAIPSEQLARIPGDKISQLLASETPEEALQRGEVLMQIAEEIERQQNAQDAGEITDNMTPEQKIAFYFEEVQKHVTELEEMLGRAKADGVSDKLIEEQKKNLAAIQDSNPDDPDFNKKIAAALSSSTRMEQAMQDSGDIAGADKMHEKIVAMQTSAANIQQNKAIEAQANAVDVKNKAADSQNKAADSQNKAADSQNKAADIENKTDDEKLTAIMQKLTDKKPLTDDEKAFWHAQMPDTPLPEIAGAQPKAQQQPDYQPVDVATHDGPSAGGAKPQSRVLGH